MKGKKEFLQVPADSGTVSRSEVPGGLVLGCLVWKLPRLGGNHSRENLAFLSRHLRGVPPPRRCLCQELQEERVHGLGLCYRNIPRSQPTALSWSQTNQRRRVFLVLCSDYDGRHHGVGEGREGIMGWVAALVAWFWYTLSPQTTHQSDPQVDGSGWILKPSQNESGSVQQNTHQKK